MGWSCRAAAGETMRAIAEACRRQTGVSNVWESGGRRYFAERSTREHADGAITGTVYRYLPCGEMVRKAGSFRIEGDGRVSRGPAHLRALAPVDEELGAALSNTEDRPAHKRARAAMDAKMRAAHSGGWPGWSL